MASHSFSNYVVLTGQSYAGGTLTFSSMATSSTANSVFDDDDSGSINSGDYYITSSIDYSGYTIEVNGETYAIFDHLGNAYIPNNGELGFGNVTNGMTVTAQADVVAANCFVDGTAIATPRGPRAIEDLRIGDTVLTANGEPKPIKWVGRQAIGRIHGLPSRRLPVIVSAHALAPGVPARDLYVSADHGLVVDGFLINAGVLVNGDTIRWAQEADLPPSFTYHHVELDDHDTLLAEGVEAESFIDYTGRAQFDNYAEYLALYGCERLIPEMGMPRISARRMLPAQIADRLGIARGGADEARHWLDRLRA